MENTTEVVIGGEIITLRSTEEPMYMQKLARYVDQKMTEIRKKSVSAAIDDKARTVIYALNIADDYIKANDKLTRLEAVHKRFVQDNGNLQKENGILNANNKALEAELARMKSEKEQLQRTLERERAQTTMTPVATETALTTNSTNNTTKNDTLPSSQPATTSKSVRKAAPKQ